VKKRRTFLIESDTLAKLRAIKVRTGLSESEQVRQGIQWWLESHEWQVGGPQLDDRATESSVETPASKRR
jgi:hypothetical protein